MKRQIHSDNMIRFDALTRTPLRAYFKGYSPDHQLELADLFLAELKSATGKENLTEEDWTFFQKNADWQTLAIICVQKQQQIAAY